MSYSTHTNPPQTHWALPPHTLYSCAPYAPCTSTPPAHGLRSPMGDRPTPGARTSEPRPGESARGWVVRVFTNVFQVESVLETPGPGPGHTRTYRHTYAPGTSPCPPLHRSVRVCVCVYPTRTGSEVRDREDPGPRLTLTVTVGPIRPVPLHPQARPRLPGRNSLSKPALPRTGSSRGATPLPGDRPKTDRNHPRFRPLSHPQPGPAGVVSRRL